MTVFANGFIGFNADAALLDPTTLTRIILFADRHVSEKLFGNCYPLPYKYVKEMKSQLKMWNIFNFEVPETISNEIFYIRKIFSAKVYQLDCGFRHFKWLVESGINNAGVTGTYLIHCIVRGTEGS